MASLSASKYPYHLIGIECVESLRFEQETILKVAIRWLTPFSVTAGKSLAALAVATGMLISHAAGAQTLLQRNVSIRLALTIAETALAECGDHVSVAIVDRTGRLKVFLQGDNAAPHNIELARRKAYTSQTFGRTSLEWAQRTESSNISGQRMLTDVITQQGGVPIKFGDETIGGVGLSGAPSGGQQEEACAEAGIAKVADQLKP
jgi:uncharacterized protein GlcG (DUF336 family)